VVCYISRLSDEKSEAALRAALGNLC